MNQSTNIVKNDLIFVMTLLILLVFNSSALADVPITILPNDKCEEVSLNENKINKIIKKNFDLDDTVLYEVKVNVLYKDSGELSHLVVYLLNNVDYSFEKTRVNLGKNYKVLSIETDYQETASEYESYQDDGYNQLYAQESIGLYQEAQLFKSVDENLQSVDMQDLIDGRPLVLVVSSCT